MLKRVCLVLVFAGLLALLFTGVRLFLVEPDQMALRCAAERMVSLVCRLRGIAIQGFAHHLFGPISIAAGVLGWIGASTYLSILAMIVGMAGTVLYDFDLSGMGLLLGALYLVYRPASTLQPQPANRTEQA